MFVDFPVGDFGCMFNGVDKLFIEGRGFLLRSYGWFVIESDNSIRLCRWIFSAEVVYSVP